MPEENVKKEQENPLSNMLINVLIPVLALSYLSKDPALEAAPKIWHLGPVKALIVALIFPLAYGVWFFVKSRKMNFFSGLGLFSVLLTGGLALFLWNKDGTVKENAAILHGLKEASIPLVLGLVILASHWSKTPMLRALLYNDTVFDIRRIESKIKEVGKEQEYQKLLFMATCLLSISFLLSTIMNFGLSLYFLGGLDHLATNAREVYNEKVAKITGWGFLVIGVPMIAFLFFTLRKILSGLRSLTGFSDEELMMPR